MASLDDLKKRIQSVKSTQKITKAMKMVAAAKLRKAQENAEKGRPYSEKMNNIILNLSNGISDKENAPKLLTGSGDEKVHLCVVLTSDRGLCGGFNSNIIENISFKDSKNVNYFDADKVGKIIISVFEKKEFDVCTIFYNQFKNVITQIPQEQQIIPLKTSETKNKSSFQNNYECEPEEDEILSNLLPKNISTQIFKAMLENSASEQGSRMTAMDNATRNAGEMVDKLTIQYNRSRQAAITKELIEIISGAESL